MGEHNSRTLPGSVEAALASAGLLGAKLVIGLSGGIDSVVLLHVLHELAGRRAFQLEALHVHHGLSPNADRWLEACVQLCNGLNVPLRVARVQVARGTGESLEAAARNARYAVYRAQEGDALLLAHHADDHAETLLLQLLRGAGAAGLAGMPPVRLLNPATGLRLVRPLLAVSRAQIQSYAERYGLHWVEDESNRNLDLDRNFLRLEMLPRIEQRFPGYRQTLSRAAANLADAAALTEVLAQLDAGPVLSEGKLLATELSALEPARARNVVRWFLRGQGVQPPPRERLAEAVKQLVHARPDAQPRIELDGVVLRRYRGWISIERSMPDLPPDWQIDWHGEDRLPLPDGSWLQFGRTTGTGMSRTRLQQARVTVRARRGGERMRLAANRPARSLKNLLQEAAVPPWVRRSLPLMFADDALVWVPGVGCDWRFQAQPQQEALAIEWIRQGSAQGEC
jgi:tRNA(Ile)-lysidine synthase